MTDFNPFFKTLDDFIDTITLSDDDRKEMIQSFAADAIEELFKGVAFDVMVRSHEDDFAPETYLEKLYYQIEKEKEIVSNLHTDIANLQRAETEMPTYYIEHFLNEDKSDLEGMQFLFWAATEIGLYIYLSETIILYASKVKDLLLSLTIGRNEANRRAFHSIFLKREKAEILHKKLTSQGFIDKNYPFSDFVKFFRLSYVWVEPKKRMKWQGKTIDLAMLIDFLSDGHPEWLVAERVFGVKSTSLKSSLSRQKKSLGYNKKLHEITTEYKDVK